MEDSASLTMLKKVGAKVAPDVKQELENPIVTQTAQTEDEVTVDVDVMNSDELDALVKQQQIDTPIEWTSWDAAGKRGWLKEQFADDGATAAAEAPAPAPAPAPAKGKKGKKAEAAAPEPTAAPHAVEPATEAAPITDKAIGETITAIAQAVAPKGKGKKKGAEVALATKSGEIVEADVLQDMVHEIENLKEPKAHALITELMEETEVTFFRLGGILSVIQANGWYQPFASFREFVEQKHGLSYRKAIYWIEIYNRLSNSGIPWGKVKDVGWTKLQMVTAYVNDENYEDYLALAEELKAYNLANVLKGKMMVANGRTIVMYFSPAQYKVFETGVVKFGAIVNGRGIIDKEKALMKALKANK